MYKIDEVFDLNGKNYIVKVDEYGFCEGCAGEGSSCKNFPECDYSFRPDDTDVIFVEIEPKQRKSP